MTAFAILSMQFLVLLNPFAVLSTFLSMTPEYDRKARRKVVLRAGITILAASLLLFFSGGIIFRIFGINIDVFRIGGGVILMVCAVTMVAGSGGLSREAAKADNEGCGDIAVVPIAIPMAVGPGTSAGIMVSGLGNDSFGMILSKLGSLFLAIALLIGLLMVGTQAERILRKRGIAIVTKLTGLFLSAIAAGMIIEGVKNFFQI